MKKTVDKDSAANFECFFNPELLFCTDATVVDYLNALLESEPARNMDFREIHFVHQDVNQNSNTTAIIGNAMLLNAEYSTTETDELRGENENLKFRTELAEIDAQVLRSEIAKLKIVKEHLIAQLREMKEQFASLRTENEVMRQTAKTASQRIGTPALAVEIYKENVQAAPPPRAEMAAVEEVVYDDDEPIIDQCEPLVLDVPQDRQPEPATVIEEHRKDYTTTVLSEQEREFFARANIPDEGVRTGNSPDATFFSRKNVAQRTPRHNAQPPSTVIKQRPAEKNSPRQGHIVKAAPPEAAPRATSSVDTRQHAMPQNHVEEAEEKLEEVAAVPAAIAAVEPLKDVGGIEMPSAPASKVAIRRNVKNYEDVQKESDPNKLVEAGHDLVL